MVSFCVILLSVFGQVVDPESYIEYGEFSSLAYEWDEVPGIVDSPGPPFPYWTSDLEDDRVYPAPCLLDGSYYECSEASEYWQEWIVGWRADHFGERVSNFGVATWYGPSGCVGVDLGREMDGPFMVLPRTTFMEGPDYYWEEVLWWWGPEEDSWNPGFINFVVCPGDAVTLYTEFPGVFDCDVSPGFLSRHGTRRGVPVEYLSMYGPDHLVIVVSDYYDGVDHLVDESGMLTVMILRKDTYGVPEYNGAYHECGPEGGGLLGCVVDWDRPLVTDGDSNWWRTSCPDLGHDGYFLMVLEWEFQGLSEGTGLLSFEALMDEHAQTQSMLSTLGASEGGTGEVSEFVWDDTESEVEDLENLLDGEGGWLESSGAALGVVQSEMETGDFSEDWQLTIPFSELSPDLDDFILSPWDAVEQGFFVDESVGLIRSMATWGVVLAIASWSVGVVAWVFGFKVWTGSS